MTGKFPACVLNIGISPELLDVNVSPSKTEVRFAYEKNVFDAVHFAVRNAVLNGDNGREIKLSKPEIPEEKPDTRPTARIMLEKATQAIEKAADSSPADDSGKQYDGYLAEKWREIAGTAERGWCGDHHSADGGGIAPRCSALCRWKKDDDPLCFSGGKGSAEAAGQES